MEYRCHRLKRPCQSADTPRRRSEKKSSSSDARIAKLEESLSQVVSLLHANKVQIGDGPKSPPEEQEQGQARPDSVAKGHRDHSPLIPTPSSLSYHGETAEDTEGSGRRTLDDPLFGNEQKDDLDGDALGASWWAIDSENSINANPAITASPQSSTLSWVNVLKAPMLLPSATTCINDFRQHKLHHCPFVHLPTNLTAEQLHRDRPFMFRAIICVMSSSTAEKRIRASELKQVLSKAVFLQESSQQPHQFSHKLDLLLGILVYIAWGWDHVHSGNSLPRLISMAASLAGEMCSDNVMCDPTAGLFDPKSCENLRGDNTRAIEMKDDSLLLERQRAILGCFVLGSAVSAYYSQANPLPWSPQMEECLSAINISGTRPDYMSDGTLAFQVRLQLLVMKAVQTCERCQLPDQPPIGALPGPALLYIKTLMIQLQDLRASIPPAFQHHVCKSTNFNYNLGFDLNE